MSNIITWGLSSETSNLITKGYGAIAVAPVIPTPTPSVGGGGRSLTELDRRLIKIPFDIYFDVIGKKFDIFKFVYNIHGKKSLYLSRFYNLIGQKQFSLDLALQLQGYKQLQLQSEYLISSILQKEHYTEIDIALGLQPHLLCEKLLYGNKMFLFDTQKVILGKKILKLKQSLKVKGKKDIQKIIMALLDIDEEN